MVLEAETGFHFRRAGDTLRLAMAEPTARWTDREEVDEALVEDWRARVSLTAIPPPRLLRSREPGPGSTT